MLSPSVNENYQYYKVPVWDRVSRAVWMASVATVQYLHVLQSVNLTLCTFIYM